jgi:Tfp pilus assembly pilus retraction ATPase PilT
MDIDFAEVLLEVIDRRASDLHITAGAPPMVRVRGRLAPMEGYPVLTPSDTREVIYSILSNAQRQGSRTTGSSTSPTRSRGPRASVSTHTSSAPRSERRFV